MKKTKLEQLTEGLGKKLDEKKPKAGGGVKVAADPLPNDDAGAERFSASFWASDKRRLDDLADYLRTQGERNVGRSLLLRVALRSVKLTPELVGHLRAAEAEDGRRK